MSVIRLKRKGKKVGKWYIDFKDHTGKPRRMPAYADKGASTTLESNIKKLADCTRANEYARVIQLSEWFEREQPPEVRNRLIKFGLLDAKKTEAGTKPLIDYLPDFQKMILAKAEKDFSGKQAKLTTARAKSIIEGCGFITWRDVNGPQINLYIGRLRKEGMKPQSARFYVKAFRRFAKWMVERGCAQKAPAIDSVKVPNRPERAFEFDEYARLLSAARSGPKRYGLTGYQRYLLLCLGMETGLRRTELRSLTPASFNFRDRTVFVKGEDTKNGDDADQDISPELAQLMQEYLRGKMPNVQLFDIQTRSAEMIQADCKAAKIDVVNVRGKIKFHTLRHTCASFLIAQGTNLKIVQKVMRHKNIKTTVDCYGHLLKGQKKSAIAKLGRLSAQHVATGTD